MKRVSRDDSATQVLALALTWDGARYPVSKLPSKARAFLKARVGSQKSPSPRAVARLLKSDQLEEIRICWVPRLKGGTAVLSEPFERVTRTRIAFRAARTIALGDHLGVIYRRSRK
jgi:hypothetical protein